MHIERAMMKLSTARPTLTVLLTLVSAALFALVLVRIKVDTNPVHILPADNPARLFQQQAHKDFGLHDMVMIGVINTRDKNGVFNPGSLKKIIQLSRFAARILNLKQSDRKDHATEIIAPDTVDTVEQAGLGRVRFHRLMAAPPKNRQEALIIRDRALKDPLLRGTIISKDGKSLALYLPIARPDVVHTLHRELQQKIAELSTDGDQFLLAGPPFTEDTASQKIPRAMLYAIALILGVTGLLMLVLFPDIRLIAAPILIALVTVVSTMGIFVGAGNTLSPVGLFLPLFILIMAPAYSMHFLSCYCDEQRGTKDPQQAITGVMHRLFSPVLTSVLASAAGFGTLAFTNIPPLQTFGVFVVVGILLAWLFTTLYLPAHLLLIHRKSQKNFATDTPRFSATLRSLLNHSVHWTNRISTGRPWMVLGLVALIMGLGAGGILMLRCATNPASWFQKSDAIRIAERMINHHFNGTGEANLILTGTDRKQSIAKAADQLSATLTKALRKTPVIQEKALAEISQAVAENNSLQELAKRLSHAWGKEIDRLAPEDDAGYEAWSHALDTLDRLRNQNRIFKQPELLHYLLTLQQYLNTRPKVGGSMSIADIIRKVHQELFEGDPGHFSIPATVNGVTQTLVSYQTLHSPDDLHNLVTRDFTRANIRLFLKGNDGKDMERLIADTNRFLSENPPPVKLTLQWAGTPYINMITNNVVTTALHKAVIIGYLAVFIVMALLERSLLQSIPVIIAPVFTLCAVFGSAGLMIGTINLPTLMLMFFPIAIAVHYSVHVLRTFATNAPPVDNNRQEDRGWDRVQARAITGGTIILSIGCLPLFFFPLIPLQRAGLLLAATVFASGTASLFIVPALLTRVKKWLLKNQVQASDQDR